MQTPNSLKPQWLLAQGSWGLVATGAPFPQVQSGQKDHVSTFGDGTLIRNQISIFLYVYKNMDASDTLVIMYCIYIYIYIFKNKYNIFHMCRISWFK